MDKCLWFSEHMGSVRTVQCKEARTMPLGASYLLKTCGLVLNVIGQQDDHAKFSTLVRHLQNLALQVRNVATWKFFLLIHHLHCFCIFLNGYKIKNTQVIPCCHSEQR